MNITDLGVPARITNALRRIGITTVQELCTRKLSEVRVVRGIAAVSIDILVQSLGKAGFKLAVE